MRFTITPRTLGKGILFASFGLLFLPAASQPTSLAQVKLIRQKGPAAQSYRSLASVLDEISRQYQVEFLYRSDRLADKKVVYAATDSPDLEGILRDLLSPTGLTFRKIDATRYAIIKKKRGPSGKDAALPAGAATPQIERIDPAAVAPASTALSITGRVSDDKGQGLPGVNILLKGTTTGTATNPEGDYSLTLPDHQAGGTLVFSFIGYTPQEVAIGNRTTLDVTLVPDVKALGEVVVVGYGTQKKSELTTSIASVSEQEIKAVPVTSLDQALKGRAAGVQVTQASAAPGGGVSIRIRGTSSLNAGAEPLYVVDGLPVFNDNTQASGRREEAGRPTNPLSYLNPGDIESIEILKDAAAASIYGARGANGVVLITTRRGKAGESRVEFESYYGLQTVRNKIPLLNATQFAQLANEANANAGVAPAFTDEQIAALGTGTDWQDQIFRTAPIRNYQLSFSGGDAKTQYAVSGNYFRQDGIIRGSDFERGSLRVNLDRKINDRLSIGNNLTVTRSKANVIVTNADGVVRTTYKFSPTLNVYTDDGLYTRSSDASPQASFERYNPVYAINDILNDQVTNRALGSIFAEYEILKGLRLRVSGGADLITTKENFFEPDGQFRTNGFAWVNSVFTTSWINTNTLTYDRTFGEKHALNLLGLYERQAARNELVQAISEGPELTTVNNLRQGLPLITPRSEASEWGIVSYGGRANYSFGGKYLVTASLRADGSSKFGKDHKFGFFPAVALGWVLSQEPFLAGNRWVTNLKLRASYGVVGNQEIGSYGSLTRIEGRFNYIFNNRKNIGFAPANVPNPDLRWERTSTANLGVDLELGSRVELTADVYYKKTYDLLWSFPLPATTGFNEVTRNVGSLQNQGLELSLNTQNLTGRFKWSTSLNFTTNANKVLSLVGRQDSVVYGYDDALVLVKGQPVGSFFGYQTDGIFQANDNIAESAVEGPGTAPGDRRYRDLDGDGRINNRDRSVIGQAAPRFFGGITNAFAYGGFELTVFFQGVYGNKVYNGTQKYDWESLNGRINNTTRVLDRWTPDNPGNTIPRANLNRRGNLVSDAYVQDASFLRLRDITLAYTLPAGLLKGLRLQRVRVYVSAQNQLTFTNYYGYDPEANAIGQSTREFGIDDSPYPTAKSVLVGLNVGF